MKNSKLIYTVMAILLSGFIHNVALAVTSTGPLLFTQIRAGWNSDTFALVPNVPILNPAKCVSPDGYVSETANPGYWTFYTAALSAFNKNKTVEVILSDDECSVNRPKIIGINVTQ